MTVHSYHPVDIHKAGLQDLCARCDQHAEYPFQSLDERMLQSLRDRVDRGSWPRSLNEARAMLKVKEALKFEEATR